MRLAVDIGNTSITCGIFQNQNMIKNLHFKTIKELIKEIDMSQFEKVITSSVVPELSKDFQKTMNEIFPAMEIYEAALIQSAAVAIPLTTGLTPPPAT